MKKLMMLVLILALALCSVPAALAEGDTPDALAAFIGAVDAPLSSRRHTFRQSLPARRA